MQDIRDNMEPEVLPTSEFPWPVLLLLIPLILGLMFFLYRRRKRPEPAPTAETVARRRLERLAAIADRREFYAALAGILNQYLEARLGLGATRLTSVEISRAFERIGVMGAGWQESLESLLAECDRAKFSEDAAEDWDRAGAMARARNIVDLLVANVASAPNLDNPWERLRDASL